MIANYKQAVPLGEPEPDVNFIDYIQSSGSQYIDTGFKPNNNSRVVIDIEVLEAGTIPIFGARVRYTGTSFVVWVVDSTELRSDFGTNGEIKSVNVSSVFDRIIVDKNKNTCAFGSASITHTSSTFSLSVNLLIFSSTSDGSVYSKKLSGRLYSCQIYDNDTLVRDYAPALDPDGVACLYDKVSEEYVYNAGTGTFVTP